MTMFQVLADANDPANVWLREHPFVMGLIALTIGAVLAYFGIAGLRSGTARDKWGNEMEGGMAVFLSVLRLLMGVAACGYGLYTMAFG